ncbi:hypothetical protein ACLMJK_006155 [Lecanora helva]
MADQAATTRSPKISLPPNEILINIASVLNTDNDLGDMTIEIDNFTTCRQALSIVQSAIAEHDRPRQWQRVRKLAIECKEAIEIGNMHTRGLNIRNAVPTIELPEPRRATLEERERLSKSFVKEGMVKEPYHTVIPAQKEQNLPTIAGKLRLFPIDWSTDPAVEINEDHCLWDTGAQFCSTTSDLVSQLNPKSLDLESHTEYRIHHDTVAVQADGYFSFSNASIDISTIFLVVPVECIPNRRSGVILGQHSFLDRMMVESVPRAIVMKRGEEVEEGVWGGICVKGYLDLDGGDAGAFTDVILKQKCFALNMR